MADADPRIEEFLDHVCAPLVGRSDFAERAALRAELRTRVAATVAAWREVGADADAAVRSALASLGPPEALARRWLRAARRPDRSRVPSPLPTTVIGLGCFGVANSLIALAVMGSFFAGDDSGRWFGPLFLAAPVAAGLCTAHLAPARHALGTFHAQAIVISAATAACVLTGSIFPPLPDRWHEATRNALLVIIAGGALLWPVGCGAAALGGWLRQRREAAPRRWRLPE